MLNICIVGGLCERLGEITVAPTDTIADLYEKLAHNQKTVGKRSPIVLAYDGGSMKDGEKLEDIPGLTSKPEVYIQYPDQTSTFAVFQFVDVKGGPSKFKDEK